MKKQIEGLNKFYTIEAKKNNKGYTYTLNYPNFELKINLVTTTKNYLFNLTIDKVSYKFSEFGGIKPNAKNNSHSTRLDLAKEIVEIIFNAYILRKSELIETLNLTRRKNNNTIVKATINDAYRDFFVSKENTIKERTQEQYIYALKNLTTTFGNHSIEAFGKLTRSEIETFLFNTTIKLKGGRFNFIKSTFRNFVDFINKNYQTYNLESKFNNHFADIAQKKVPKAEINKPPTTDEYRKMIDWLTQNQSTHITLRIGMDIIFETQIRPVELVNIQIKHIDFTQRTINLNDELFKGSHHVLRLPQQIINFIISQIKKSNLTIETASERYLFGQKNTFISVEQMPSYVFTNQFRDLRTALDLPISYKFYGMKHYANIQKFHNMAEVGLLPDEIIGYLMAFNGHPNRSTTEIYLQNLGLYTISLPQNVLSAITNKHNTYEYSI